MPIILLSSHDATSQRGTASTPMHAVLRGEVFQLLLEVYDWEMIGK